MTSRILLSEKNYWILLIIFFGFIIFIDWVWISSWVGIMPVSWDIGVNLLADSIFMIFTIFFLSLLFSLRERRQWKPVKDKILERCGEQIDALFMLLQNLLDDEISNDHEESLLIQLNSLDSIPLRKDIKKYLSSNGYDIVGYIHYLEEIAGELRDIEINYYSILEPELMDAIMEIESSSRILASGFRISKGYIFKDEKKWYKEKVAPIIQRLIKEIYKTQNMGIKIRPYKEIVRLSFKPLGLDPDIIQVKPEIKTLRELENIKLKLNDIAKDLEGIKRQLANKRFMPDYPTH